MLIVLYFAASKCNFKRYWKIGEKIAILEEKVSAIFYVVWFVSLTFYDLVVPFLRTIGSPLGQKRVPWRRRNRNIILTSTVRRNVFRQLGPFLAAIDGWRIKEIRSSEITLRGPSRFHINHRTQIQKRVLQEMQIHILGRSVVGAFCNRLQVSCLWAGMEIFVNIKLKSRKFLAGSV